MSVQTINLAVNEFHSSQMLLFLHLKYSPKSETSGKKDDLKDKFLHLSSFVWYCSQLTVSK